MSDTLTHRDLLAELERYRGGEFVPKFGLMKMTLDDPDCDGGYLVWRDSDGSQSVVPAWDAHAHIERMAWKAVRDYCNEQSGGMFTHKKDGTVFIKIIVSNKLDDDMDSWRILGSGPDDVTALTLAMRHMNKEHPHD